MERKQAIILFLIFAAFIALIAVDWRGVLGIQGTMLAEPVTPDDGGSIGPATAIANVPLSRFVYPPNLGGYAVDAKPANVNDDRRDMFSCGVC